MLNIVEFGLISKDFKGLRALYQVFFNFPICRCFYEHKFKQLIFVIRRLLAALIAGGVLVTFDRSADPCREEQENQLEF